MKPIEGQMEMWEMPVVEEPAYLGTAVPRPSVGGRAGTPLNHKFTSEITGRGRRGALVHGLYDESQRLYQGGGEISSFIYWKERWVTLAKDAWDAVIDRADWIEMIDHEANECWRIRTKKARQHAVEYNAGIGPRVGVPMMYWDVIRGTGTYKRRGRQ